MDGGTPQALLTASLPPERQAEVLDFVVFLATRKAAGAPRGVDEWTDAAFQAFALDPIADDDDPVTYALSDCREVR